jgi:dienelactone hydrolase
MISRQEVTEIIATTRKIVSSEGRIANRACSLYSPALGWTTLQSYSGTSAVRERHTRPTIQKALAPSITIEPMTSDAEEAIRYLQRQYGKRTIFLLGHSWGGPLEVLHTSLARFCLCRSATREGCRKELSIGS